MPRKNPSTKKSKRPPQQRSLMNKNAKKGRSLNTTRTTTVKAKKGRNPNKYQ